MPAGDGHNFIANFSKFLVFYLNCHGHKDLN